MQILPFTADYDQRFITQLGDEKYVIDARWNERGQAWSFDLTRDSDQVQLLAGAPMQIGQDLLAPDALGIGGLIVSDLSRKDTDAGPEDLGDRVIVAWLSPDELAAIKAVLGPAGASIVLSGVVPPISSAGSSSSAGTGSAGTGTGGPTIVNTTVSNLTLIGGGFGSDIEQSDALNTETLVYRFPINAGLNPNPTLKAIASLITQGTGTVRMYLDTMKGSIGDTGTPSGTLVGSAIVPGTTFISGAPLTNPGGMVYVKVTVQSAPSATVQVDVISGAVG